MSRTVIDEDFYAGWIKLYTDHRRFLWTALPILSLLFVINIVYALLPPYHLSIFNLVAAAFVAYAIRRHIRELESIPEEIREVERLRDLWRASQAEAKQLVESNGGKIREP